MFKDGEVSSKFNNKKTAKFAKSSIVAVIFEKYYQKGKLKLMKSFDATKKNYCRIYVFEGSIPTPKERLKWAFVAFFRIFRLNEEVLNIICQSRD